MNSQIYAKVDIYIQIFRDRKGIVREICTYRYRAMRSEIRQVLIKRSDVNTEHKGRLRNKLQQYN